MAKQTIRYEVVGQTSAPNRIYVSVTTGSDGTVEYFPAVDFPAPGQPWTKTVTLDEETGIQAMIDCTLVDASAGDLRVRIYRDNKVVREATANGGYAMAKTGVLLVNASSSLLGIGISI